MARWRGSVWCAVVFPFFGASRLSEASGNGDAFAHSLLNLVVVGRQQLPIAVPGRGRASRRTSPGYERVGPATHRRCPR